MEENLNTFPNKEDMIFGDFFHATRYYYYSWLSPTKYMVSECNFKFNAKYSGRYITTEVSIYLPIP